MAHLGRIAISLVVSLAAATAISCTAQEPVKTASHDPELKAAGHAPPRMSPHPATFAQALDDLADIAFDPEKVGLLAVAGLKDDVKRDAPAIIEDLEDQLDNTDTLGLRNALHFTLKELYKAQGNHEKVLEHLRALLSENDQAIQDKEARESGNSDQDKGDEEKEEKATPEDGRF